MGSIIPVSIVMFVRNCRADGFELWMQTRSEQGSLNGLWEFPGGKIEAGESAEQAACREIQEEVGLEIKIEELKLLTMHPYQYETKSICLYTYFVHKDEVPTGLKTQQWFPVSCEQLSQPFAGKIPPVNHHLIDLLGKHLLAEL